MTDIEAQLDQVWRRLPESVRRMSLFERSLAASLGAHVLLFGFLLWRPSQPPIDPADIMDVDLRTPFMPRKAGDTRLPGRMKGAPAPDTLKKAPVPILHPAEVQPGPKSTPGDAAAVPAEKPKDWVLPGPNTQRIEKPSLESAAPQAQPNFTAPGGAGPGGMNGPGLGTRGEGAGADIVNRPPELINREEVKANLRRFYPELARRAGQQGRVVVSVEVDVDGAVGNVDVLASAGSDFDAAAASVAKLMRFRPALKASIAVKSTVKVPIIFQLQD